MPLFMKIGIDIDGVINDQEQFNLKCGKQFCRKYHLRCVPDLSAYEAEDIFGWAKPDYRRFQQEYYQDFFLTDSYIRTHAKETIRCLREKHQIYIITARKTTLPERLGSSGTVDAITEKWLQDAGIEYDKYFRAPTISEKWTILKHRQIDVMIEDSPAFFVYSALYPSITTVCFDAAYNRDFPGTKTVPRIYSWNDAFNFINNLERRVG